MTADGISAHGAPVPPNLRGRSLVRSPLLWIGLAFTAGFGYFAVRDVHLADTWAALRGSDYRWLVPATAVFGVAILLRVVRWRALFHAETQPALPATARALLIGYFFNNLLPLRAGEAARIIALKRMSATPRAEAASTVVIERIYDLASLFALLFLALLWLPDLAWAPTAAVFGLALAAGVAVAVVVLTRWRDRLVRVGMRAAALIPLISRERGEVAVMSAMRGFVGLTRTRTALVALGWTLLSWCVMAVSFWLVMRCFDLNLSPMAGLLVVIATSLSLTLPSSPAALGVFEAAVVLALDAYGIPRAEALSYALVLHAMNFLPFVVVGAFALRPRLLSPWRAVERVSRA